MTDFKCSERAKAYGNHLKICKKSGFVNLFKASEQLSGPSRVEVD